MAEPVASFPVPNYIIHVTIIIAPSDVPEFLKAVEILFLQVTAEPECTFVQILQKPEQPGVFRFVEAWSATREWLHEVQLGKPYYAPYIAATEKMWLKPREIEIYECVPGLTVLKPTHVWDH